MQTLHLDKNKLIVFVHISGPKETRRPIILKIIEASQNIPDIQFIFSEGKAKGNIIPEKILGIFGITNGVLVEMKFSNFPTR